MRKTRIKIIIIIFLLLLVILPKFCYAIDIGLGDLNNYGKNMADSRNLKEMVGPIIAVIQIIGSLASVIVLIIIGIKYMIGSIEERAEYKKTLVTYVIGCSIVFALSNLLGIIFNITTSILN